MQKNIDLLRLEIKTLWERDRYGRLRPDPLAALAVADDGLAARFSPDLPSELRKRLENVCLEGLPSHVVLEEYRRLIESIHAVEVKGWACYVFPPEGVWAEATELEIATPADVVPRVLAEGRPQAWWEAHEWEDLLAGRLGPWAIGIVEGSVVAICHTPVGSSAAAEAGVWTHPEWRGRGYAGAVTASWAEVAQKEFPTLFYSASAENSASQAVARKLGLTSIGRIWQIEVED